MTCDTCRIDSSSSREAGETLVFARSGNEISSTQLKARSVKINPYDTVCFDVVETGAWDGGSAHRLR